MIAHTPEPPYLAAIFSSQRTEGDQGYAAMADRMVELAQTQPGFLGMESARDAAGFGITVSYWRDEAAIAAWKAHAEHAVAQRLGREQWYGAFHLRICRVERAYSANAANAAYDTGQPLMLAWLAYLTVAVVWGSTYFAIALGLESFTPYGMVAVRFSVAAMLALGLGRLRREPWPPLREVGHLMVVGALLLGGSNALVSYAELHVSTGLVAVLAALVPLWLAVFSMAREPLGPKGWAGIALGIAGVAVLVWPSGGLRIHTGGLVAMVAAPLIWSWGTLHGKHFVHGGGLFTNGGIQMLTAAVIGLFVSPLSGGFLRGPLTPKALWAVGYLALFGSLLAFSAYIYLAKAWPPAKMGTYAYLNPLVAVLLGSIILHEAFGLREILGMAVILAAVALVQLRAKVVRSEVTADS